MDAQVQAELTLLPPGDRVEAVEAALRGEMDLGSSDDSVSEEGGHPPTVMLGKDAQELRVVQALALMHLQQHVEALVVWRSLAAFTCHHCPPFDEALVVHATQASLCALMCGCSMVTDYITIAVSTHLVVCGADLFRWRYRLEVESSSVSQDAKDRFWSLASESVVSASKPWAQIVAAWRFNAEEIPEAYSQSASPSAIEDERLAACLSVAGEVEDILRRQRHGLSAGSYGEREWNSPTSLWSDQELRKQWYGGAKEYWDKTETTVDGVLGGYSKLDGPDVIVSRRFLSRLRKERPNWCSEQGVSRVADVGAGIGRVTKHLLLPGGFTEVELIEQSPNLIKAAQDFIAQAGHCQGVAVGGMKAEAQCRYVCRGMQAWTPLRMRYDCIWVQWCVGQLTDSDFVAFLRRCRGGLAPNGILVIKDNCLDGLHKARGADSLSMHYDDDDHSVCRCHAYFQALFKKAGACVMLEEQQPVEPKEDARKNANSGAAPANERFPSDIFPVMMWALQWQDDAGGWNKGRWIRRI